MPPTTHSDSEDDLDYIPPADGYDSDSSDKHYEPSAVRAPPPTDPTEQKKQRDALWATFQASVSTLPSNGHGNGASLSTPPVKRVNIEKTYLFAGKHVTDVVEVPEDSEEAKKWPSWSPRPPASNDTSVPVHTRSSEQEKEEYEGEGERRNSNGNASLPATPSSAPATLATSTSGGKRPGPRKPRTVLPSIPKEPQAKKITTLDKSAMDWRMHVASQSSDIKDELDTNRRGGGYLEKVEFLKRVEDRREDVFEASKASKRRRT